MSRRRRRWDTWIDRQVRGHERRSKQYNGFHSRWWALGQEQLRWEEHVAAHPDAATEALEMPF